jgi:hypothetical protein
MVLSVLGTFLWYGMVLSVHICMLVIRGVRLVGTTVKLVLFVSVKVMANEIVVGSITCG